MLHYVKRGIDLVISSSQNLKNGQNNFPVEHIYKSLQMWKAWLVFPVIGG